MCNLLGLALSAYKYYLKNGSQKYNQEIIEMVTTMSEKFPTYGYHRLTIAIKREYGISLNRKTIHRYRKHLGISAVTRKKQSRSKNGLVESKVAPNIVNRNFKPIRKNKIWSIDITYIPQGDGNRSYLFAIKDLYDKSIIDYEVSRIMSIPFVLRGLKRAISNNDTTDLVIHSDQGVHFTCRQYISLLEEHNITISHSRKGNCHDNAPIESFFALYKKEALWLNNPYTYKDTVKQIHKYIIYYNQQRLQIGLNEIRLVFFLLQS